MFQRLKHLLTGEKGASPWVAVFSITVLLAFTAMVVDLGAAYMQASKLQSALDAGALAGAEYLPNTAYATQAAIECVELNGYTASDVNISFSESNSKISLTAAKETDTMFLQVLGIDQWDISRKAAAAKVDGGSSGVFDYRIFYGDANSTYAVGGTFNIDGDVHCNGGYNANPGTSTITGSLEVVKKLQYNHGTLSVGNIVNPAEFIEMPDFTEAVNKIMPATYDRYVSNKTIEKEKVWTGNIYVNGNVNTDVTPIINGNVYINGNLNLDGGAPVLTLNGNLYVNGNIKFGNTVYASGSIMATGNILFQGGSYQIQTTSPVCIYSANGNIEVTMSSITATGILYAPNGIISLAGSNLTIHGSIVARKINGSPNGLTVDGPSQPIDFLPGGDPTIKLVE